MKRILKFGALALVLVLVTGCGSNGGNKLSCSYKQTRNDEKRERTYTYTFNKDDEITKAEVVEKYTYDDKDDAKDFKEDMEDELEDLEDIDGISHSVKLSGKTVTVTVKADVKKMDDDDIEDQFEEFFNVDAESSRKEVKKYFKNYDYKCK